MPEIIGYIREILCEHTDNLKYDNYRIIRLEENAGYTAKILDMKVVSKTVTPTGYPSTVVLNADSLAEGFEFSHWLNVSANGRSSNPVYIRDCTSQFTYICSYNGNLSPIPYTCFAVYVKRNNN